MGPSSGTAGGPRGGRGPCRILTSLSGRKEGPGGPGGPWGPGGPLGPTPGSPWEHKMPGHSWKHSPAMDQGCLPTAPARWDSPSHPWGPRLLGFPGSPVGLCHPGRHRQAAEAGRRPLCPIASEPQTCSFVAVSRDVCSRPQHRAPWRSRAGPELGPRVGTSDPGGSRGSARDPA